jgi:hypothetical protein
MVRPDFLSDDAAAVLAWMWDLDTRGGGFTRRGVRGWARREDVERATGMRLPEMLPGLRQRGFVLEERLEIRGTRPVLLYRITALGDVVLSQRQKREPRPPWPAGDPDPADFSVCLPAGASVALRLLREALSDPRPSRYAGPGWRTEEELWTQLEPELERHGSIVDPGPWLPGDPPWQAKRASGPQPANPAPVFGRVDLDWLERAGFALRTTVMPPGRKRAVVVWRLSSAGASVTELRWHAPAEE